MCWFIHIKDCLLGKSSQSCPSELKGFENSGNGDPYSYDHDPDSHSEQTVQCLLCAPVIAMGCQELHISEESENQSFTGCFNVSIASQTISGYCTFLGISSTNVVPSMPVTVLFTESTDVVSSFSSTESFFSCTQPVENEASHSITISSLASMPDSSVTMIKITSQHVLHQSPTLSTTTVLSSSPSSDAAVWGVVVGVSIIMTAIALAFVIIVSIAVKRSKSTVHKVT